MNLCLCGCGQEVRLEYHKFIHGHNGRGLKRSDKTKQKMSESQKGHKVSEKQKIRHSERMKGRKAWNKDKQMSEEYKQKCSKRQKGISHPCSEEQKQKISKVKNGQNLRPNNPELLIFNILNWLYPGQWNYTGDFSFTINGKNPDFINLRTKQTIDYFGDFYHKSEEQIEREEHFFNNGYESLIIWESEVKELDDLIYRIKRFCSYE